MQSIKFNQLTLCRLLFFISSSSLLELPWPSELELDWKEGDDDEKEEDDCWREEEEE